MNCKCKWEFIIVKVFSSGDFIQLCCCCLAPDSFVSLWRIFLLKHRIKNEKWMKNSFENKNELSSLTHLHTHTHTHTHIYLYDKVFFALTAQKKKQKLFEKEKWKWKRKRKSLKQGTISWNHLFFVSRKNKKKVFFGNFILKKWVVDTWRFRFGTIYQKPNKITLPSFSWQFFQFLDIHFHQRICVWHFFFVLFS